MEKSFGGYHPVINFIFFIGAALFGMFFAHPIFLTLSVLLSSTYYFILKGAKGIRFYLSMLVFFMIISILNPIFNTLGNKVLFHYFGGRPFTLEALLYGIATGGMFLTVILWFSCYNEIMTSDKFTYMFGRFVPSLSMVFCIVLRFVPNYKIKAQTIAGARKCIGKAPDNHEKEELLRDGTTILSVLTSWAFEGAAITADSMKSRGYGCGRRANFSIYRFTRRDKVMSIYLTVCLAAIIAGILMGATEMNYLPVLSGPAAGWDLAIGLIGYGAFLAAPVGIELREETIWHISRSKI